MSSGFHYCQRCDDAFGPSHFVCRKELAYAQEQVRELDSKTCGACQKTEDDLDKAREEIATLKADLTGYRKGMAQMILDLVALKGLLRHERDCGACGEGSCLDCGADHAREIEEALDEK